MGGGYKKDKGKPNLALIPKEAIFEMAKVLSFGATKYSKYNYREGLELTRIISASLRHIYQFLDGEDIDEESKCNHLGNAMSGLAMAIWTHKNKPEMDDRWVDNSKKK